MHLVDSDDCEQCSGVLEELENIDDDCNRHQIKFVKTQDFTIAEQYGITDFPVLVYFEENVPNVYEGRLIICNFETPGLLHSVRRLFCHFQNLITNYHDKIQVETCRKQ